MKPPFPIHGWKGLDVVAKNYYGMDDGLGYIWAFFLWGKALHLQSNGRRVAAKSLCTGSKRPKRVGERARIFFSVVYIWVTFIGAS